MKLYEIVWNSDSENNTSIVCTSTRRRFIMYVYEFRYNDLTNFEHRLRGTDMDQQFTEFVHLSKNWKDLARRCGYELVRVEVWA